MRRQAILLVGVFSLGCQSASPTLREAPTVTRYFGEPLPQISASQGAAFNRGSRLFAQDWSARRTGVANAPNCVACHSVPTPGGSGMTERALVAIDQTAEAGSREETIQRISPHTLANEYRRTPPLFGTGYLEATAATSNVGPYRVGAHNRGLSLESFVSSAFATELGVATPKHCPRSVTDKRYPVGCTARISNRDIEDVVTYIRLLAPPAPPSRSTPERIALFDYLGCSGCHTVAITTGKSSYPALGSATFHPFSDLRAHDIGTSTRGSIRTTPLWGMNSYGPPYLHNGSAKSIELAVAAHHGEAETARQRFDALPPAQRSEFLDYLRSLLGQFHQTRRSKQPGTSRMAAFGFGCPHNA